MQNQGVISDKVSWRSTTLNSCKSADHDVRLVIPLTKNCDETFLELDLNHSAETF